MNKDFDGCGKGEVPAKEVDGEPEIAALVKEAKAQGIDDDFIKKVIAASESTENTITDLRGLTEKKKPVPKLPPLRHRGRGLEAFEEEIFERIINGVCEPETVVG